ncbi:MAG: ECF-type sigma factor [Gemmatimonadales bacterium]
MTQSDAEREAVDRLFTLAYEELRRLASVVRRGDPSQTLSPTALVNEAWLKLAASPPGELSPEHFKRVAARAMRQVLVEAARHRTAAKRGGPGLALVTFDEALAIATATSDELLELDAALEHLAALSPRQAQLVELRFFGGFDIPECARLLNTSEATMTRDWRAARAWLAVELRKTNQ